jgi:hypothetical protein
MHAPSYTPLVLVAAILAAVLFLSLPHKPVSGPPLPPRLWTLSR